MFNYQNYKLEILRLNLIELKKILKAFLYVNKK